MAYGSGYPGGYADLSLLADLFIVPTVFGATDPKLVEQAEAAILSNYWRAYTSDALWSHVDAIKAPLIFVLVDGVWVSRRTVLPDDVALGRRVVGGGYRSEVTAQDLADMVADGVLTVGQADGAEPVV